VNIKPQDILVVLKLAQQGNWVGTYAALAEELGLSASEVHMAIRRLGEARLLEPDGKHVRRLALRNFLVHGLPYAFPARTKEVTRGIPTAWAAPIFAGKVVSGDQLPPVWPDPEGVVQGLSVKPLYPSVGAAARKDKLLYSLLAAVDALRLGRARERAAAEQVIDELLPSHG
jgi:DNA-binding Lrp family transcriptional regulator